MIADVQRMRSKSTSNKRKVFTLFSVFNRMLSYSDQISQFYIKHSQMLAKCLVCFPSSADMEVPSNDGRFIGAVKPHAYGIALNKGRADVPRLTRIFIGGPLTNESFFTL